MNRYRKAIACFLTGATAFAALFWPPIVDVAGPEAIFAVATVLATLLVERFPNDPMPTKEP